MAGRLGPHRILAVHILFQRRIWSHWAQTIRAMRALGVIVRFACLGCRRLFDVDLSALAILRGAE